MIRPIAVAFLLLLCIPVLPAIASEHYSPSTLSVEVGNDITTSFVCIHPYTAWGGSISTAGRVEFNGGVNVPSGGWNIRNLFGMDFSQGADGKVESGAFVNRFSILHLRSPHIESRVSVAVAVNYSRDSGCDVQQIVAESLPNTPMLLGVRYDLQTWFEHPAKTWLGPLLELETQRLRFSISPQLQFGARESRCYLSFTGFF
jgi:hypothetical protein